ncbi:cysteine synthase family protein [Mastigocladus laminosus UU774]|nr:cysteine synthase family protein [Mastigocladus laminosus UU774]
MIFDTVIQMIGKTPILRLPVTRTDWDLLLKIEKGNPGGSMKDRMAYNMILDAQRNGRLKPGGTIIASTSGNTGTGLAIVAAVLGYRFIAVVDHHASKDKIRLMKAYGATIHYISGDYAEDEVATRAREIEEERLAATIPGAISIKQADNLANREGYYPMAEEIYKEIGTNLDILIGSVGTGGSLCGTGRRLKNRYIPSLKVIGVEPEGSIAFGGKAASYYQSGTGTPGGVKPGKNIDYTLIDKGYKVSDNAAFNTARYLARIYGILVGGCAGGVIYQALKLISEASSPGRMLVIVPDGGEKYLDTVFDDAWMIQKNLISPEVEKRLKSWIAPHAHRSLASVL